MEQVKFLKPFGAPKTPQIYFFIAARGGVSCRLVWGASGAPNMERPWCPKFFFNVFFIAASSGAPTAPWIWGAHAASGGDKENKKIKNWGAGGASLEAAAYAASGGDKKINLGRLRRPKWF